MAETAQQLVDQYTKKRIRIEVYFKEFPWLERYVKTQNIDEVRVGRINREVIDSGPRVYRTKENKDLFLGGGVERYKDEWLLIDQQGNLCCKLGSIHHERKPNYRWWNPRTWSYTEEIYESLSEGLIRLGDRSGDVAYVLVLRPQEERQEIYIYKSPKNFTLNDWVGHLRLEAENALRQQIAEAEQEVKQEVESL